ncbi:hypothetical protein GCK72_011123 [Caenorhabditis remanei]|uniref:Uncharacterized protein n=1 Tax=Caenorhabditis remanei TaxID=31234 RepID=A0A6A5H4R7_CAERE|nr:hypothetical protein GCK72_011123 [Caenorhabditis remanei]KAF1762860.1 hypothetical protein GCK72_011123 [Caenorhabditis remanei]
MKIFDFLSILLVFVSVGVAVVSAEPDCSSIDCSAPNMDCPESVRDQKCGGSDIVEKSTTRGHRNYRRIY